MLFQVLHSLTPQKSLRAGVSNSIQQKLTVGHETPCLTVTLFGLACLAILLVCNILTSGGVAVVAVGQTAAQGASTVASVLAVSKCAE